MATITIDGVDYDVDTLSEEAKAQLISLQATDQKITQAQQDLAIFQTARVANAAALNQLSAEAPDPEAD